MKKSIVSFAIATVIASFAQYSVAAVQTMVSPLGTGQVVSSNRFPQGTQGQFVLYDPVDQLNLRLGYKQDYSYDLDAITANIVANDAAATKAQAGVDANKTTITTETTRAAAEEKRLDSVKADKKTVSDLASTEAKHYSAVQQRADDLDTRIVANKAAQDKTNKVVAAHTQQLADHENRIQDLEAGRGYGNKFNDLKNQVDQNRKDASAGIAGVAAIATIPQVIQGQTFNVGAGVGTHDGENAIAVGFSARMAESVVGKLAVSSDTQSGFTAGAGVAVGW